MSLTPPNNRSISDNTLTRTFTLANFVDAVAFVNRIVPLAESANHHPDILIFAYKNVKISLSTHDAGNTVTQKDIDLAEQINGIFL